MHGRRRLPDHAVGQLPEKEPEATEAGLPRGTVPDRARQQGGRRLRPQPETFHRSRSQPGGVPQQPVQQVRRIPQHHKRQAVAPRHRGR